MSHFTLFQKEISFADSDDRYYAFMQECDQAMRLAGKDFREYYCEQGNIRSVLVDYMDRAKEITERRAMDVLFKKLPEAGIYDVSEKTFRETCWNLEEAEDAFDEIVELYNEIEEELALQKAYREERKQSRGKFVGGGFGLGGAIKGAATAGALNLATGLGHSVANAIGNAGSSVSAATAKDRLYENDDTFQRLSKGIRFSVWDIFVEYILLVNARFQDADSLYYTNTAFDKDRATALFENAKNIPDKTEELLVESLRLCPYSVDTLAYVFEYFPNERKTICEMAEFYGIDLSVCYEAAFSTLYLQADQEDETSLLAARAEIEKTMQAYGIKTSDTLADLDGRYLCLVWERSYQNTLPENRTEALACIRNFDTDSELKQKFIHRKAIWELAKDCDVHFSDKEKLEMINKEYTALVREKATDAKKQTLLHNMLTALDLASDQEKKEELFYLLGDRAAYEKPINEETCVKKEQLLADIAQKIERTIDIYDIGSENYLHYRKGDAHKHAQELKCIDLNPGEYVLLVYTESTDPKKIYHTGFVLTDRRFVCKGCGDVEIPTDEPVTFKSGGFLSDDIKISTNYADYRVSVMQLRHRKDLADCLNEALDSLFRNQSALREIDMERNEGAQEQLMHCVQDNPFLIQCLGLQDKAARILAEGDQAAQERKQRQVTRILESVSKSNPLGIATTWLRLHNDGYAAELYAPQLEELLQTIAQTTKSTKTLEQVEEARQKVLPYANADYIDALKTSIDSRRPVVAQMEKQRQQEQEIALIWENCNLKNLSSVLSCWDRFVQSDCPPDLYQQHLEELGSAIEAILSRGSGVSALTDLRNQLAETNEERYRGYIRQAEEKIQAAEIAERTYQGIVFDSAEETAQAQEEEKKLDIIMRMVSPDDEQSIENAILAVSQSSSAIKQRYLDQLNDYKQAIALQKRTFKGVVYETQELAENAQQIYMSMRSIMDELNWNSEDNVLLAYRQLLAMDHPITTENLQQLKNRLDAFDMQKRTVDGILFDTLPLAETAREEYAFIQSRLERWDGNDEAKMLAIREEIASCTTQVKDKYLAFAEKTLQEYDIKMRTFRGTVCDSRELAQRLRDEEKAVADILASVNENDEQSMFTALQNLGNLSTFLKDAPIERVKQMLTAYDIKMRTVEGVLYDSREEAQLVAAELRRAEEIMQTVREDDEQSILKAQQLVLELTTAVRDVKYEQLKQIWEAYDLKVRTYQGIVFETRKQAATAQQVHTEFLEQFNTLDLSQRKSLNTLNYFIEDQIPQELKAQCSKMTDDLKNTLDVIDYIIRTDEKIDLNTQKKESAELHKTIENVLPVMKHYRMNTQQMQALKDKHFASLNAAKKLFSFLKSKL